MDWTGLVKIICKVATLASRTSFQVFRIFRTSVLDEASIGSKVALEKKNQIKIILKLCNRLLLLFSNKFTCPVPDAKEATLLETTLVSYSPVFNINLNVGNICVIMINGLSFEGRFFLEKLWEPRQMFRCQNAPIRTYYRT